MRYDRKIEKFPFICVRVRVSVCVAYKELSDQIHLLLDEFRSALKLYRIYILIVAHTILTYESIAQQWRRGKSMQTKILKNIATTTKRRNKKSPAEKTTIVLITFRLYFPLKLTYFDKQYLLFGLCRISLCLS